MNRLHVEINDGRKAFSPGETLAGTVRWELDDPPRGLELRLFWFTLGKGTQDMGTVSSITFKDTGAQGRDQFRFELPDGPYSFSGKLVSLVWALELVSEHPGLAERVEIVVAPEGREVMLAKGLAT